jgi:hypothetical protein
MKLEVISIEQGLKRNAALSIEKILDNDYLRFKNTLKDFFINLDNSIKLTE